MRVFLALGSNLGDRERYLREAVDSLPGVVACSPVYETEPVGAPPGQLPYLNLVVELETETAPRQLLGLCHRLEAAAGRVRDERWGPRPLDVDILLMGDLHVDEPGLTIPHPRMRQRRFVMAPLADLAPEVAGDGWEAEVEGSVRRVGKL